MNPMFLFGLACVGVILLVALGFEIMVFRVACALADVPRPSVPRTVGLVLVLLAVPAIVDALTTAGLIEIYRATRYPLWEVAVVEFFLALPIHMVICSAIHARMMGVPMRDGLAVWLVEKLVKFGLFLPVGGLAVLVLLAASGK